MCCYCNEKEIIFNAKQCVKLLGYVCTCVCVCVCVCVRMPVCSDTHFLTHLAMVSQLRSHALLWDAGAGVLQDQAVFTSWQL